MKIYIPGFNVPIHAIVIFIFCSLFFGANCAEEPTSTSGITKAEVTVPKGSDGLTTEQRNVGARLKADNAPGAIKHLYVISAYSGQTLIYSTVKGKVTSSGKRLSPTVASGSANSPGAFVFSTKNSRVYTNEVLQDDGTYGSSTEYLYWWDTKDVYHQHYVQGGQILHVSSEPLSVKSVVINMEVSAKKDDVHDVTPPVTVTTTPPDSPKKK